MGIILYWYKLKRIFLKKTLFQTESALMFTKKYSLRTIPAHYPSPAEKSFPLKDRCDPNESFLIIGEETQLLKKYVQE